MVIDVRGARSPTTSLIVVLPNPGSPRFSTPTRELWRRSSVLRSFEAQHVYLPSSRFALNIRRQRKPRSHHGIQPQNRQIHQHRPAPHDGRLVARGQLSLRRPDVSLRQTCAQATAKQEHVNPRLLSHLRATPGLSVSYVRLSRLLQERGINLIIIISPGRSGAGLEGVEWFVPR